MIDRRGAIKTAGILLGGALIASNGVLAACARSGETRVSRALTADDESLIEEIADTILPTTAASPGAKAAAVGPTINLILSDCYDAEAQQRVTRALAEFRAACRRKKNAEFPALSRADREQFLRQIELEAKVAASPHYFPLIRELAQGAYFSSEIGATRALRYIM